MRVRQWSFCGLCVGQHKLHYLLVPNSAKAHIEARITAPDLRGKVEVMFEGRNAAVRDGLFEDTFDPYAAHVQVVGPVPTV